MKNKEEIIIKYLDGQLNPIEKAEFEDSLKKSKELKNLFDEYKMVYNSVESVKKVTLTEDYAVSIIPEFRRRLEAKKSVRYNLRYAYGFAALIFIALTLLFISRDLSSDKIGDVQFADNDITDAELENIFDQISAEDLLYVYTDEEANKLDLVYESYYSNEIISKENADENLFALNNLDFSDIENILSDEELDLVYNEIINKEFF